MLAECSIDDLRDIVESLPQCAFVVEVGAAGEFRYIALNRQQAETLELPAAALLGRTPAEVLQPESAAIVAGHYWNCANSGAPEEYEAEIAVKGGDRRLSKTTLSPLRARDGRIPRLLGISYDVTERRAGQAALAASEGRFRTILESASTGILILAPESGQILMANAAGESLFGYGQGGMLGLNYFALLAAGSRESAEQNHAASPSSLSGSFRAERRYVRSDGSAFWGEVNGAPATDPTTGRALWVAVLQDLTAVKLAEQRLRDAISSSDDGFALFDARERLVTCNQSYADIYEAPAASLTGKPASWFANEIWERRVTAGMTDSAVEPYVTRLLGSFRAADGTPLTTRATDGRWMVIRHRRTQEGGTVVVRNEITTLKRREEELERANAELKRLAADLAAAKRGADQARIQAEGASRAKSDFLASMSHELRTPLNAIIGFAEIMQQQLFGPLGDQHYDDYVGDVLASAQHLLALINELLDLAKIEAGKTVLEEAPVDLALLMKHTVKLLQGPAARKRLTLVARADNAPQIVADERALKQMLLNLLSNAIKFTAQDGRIELGCNVDDEFIRITVTDDGIGIPPEDVSKVLDPFQQASNSWAVNEHGTGLGLSIVRGMAELHGGSLSLTSEVGVGTVATIALPARRLFNPASDGA